MTERLDAVVIGAGISGLTTAYYLCKDGFNVAVIESSDRVGGVIESNRHDGFLCEYGPNSALDLSGALSRVVTALGIENRVATVSPSAKKRFVLKDGKPCLMPSSPASLVSSRLFTARGKWRLLSEPFVRSAPRDDEESFAGFVRRRFGQEALDNVADPFASGVYAGDPERLGARSAFPAIVRYEEEASSVIRGVIRSAKVRRRKGEARATMMSFDDGMQVLTTELHDRLSGDVRLGCEVVAITREADGWITSIASAYGEETLRSRTVVLSTPASVTANLVAPLDEQVADTLRTVPYAGIGMVHLGFNIDQVGHDLAGFGVLVPSREQRRILGILFSSSLFSSRAPDGNVLLTVMMGGTRQADLLDESDDALVEIAISEVSDALEISGEPVVQRVRRRIRAIPQYTMKHGAVDDAVRTLEVGQAGLVIAANYCGGVSVPDCIATAEKAASRLSQSLR